LGNFPEVKTLGFALRLLFLDDAIFTSLVTYNILDAKIKVTRSDAGLPKESPVATTLAQTHMGAGFYINGGTVLHRRTTGAAGQAFNTQTNVIETYPSDTPVFFDEITHQENILWQASGKPRRRRDAPFVPETIEEDI
jgi:hypothetical protein